MSILEVCSKKWAKWSQKTKELLEPSSSMQAADEEAPSMIPSINHNYGETILASLNASACRVHSY